MIGTFASVATSTKQRPASRAAVPVFLQRKCPCGGSVGLAGECESCQRQKLQRRTRNRSEAWEAPSIVHEVLHSSGQPLDAATRAFFEPRFGHDFGRVRVHTDAKAAESARAIHALAYTVGQEVVMGDEHYAPDTVAGRKLLAHELTHVVQQGANGPPVQRNFTVGDPADAAEHEADAVAAHITAGSWPDSPVFQGAIGGHVLQRQTSGGEDTKKPPEKKEAEQPITEGLKTVAEQAKDNNPKVKQVIIDPIKDRLKSEWKRFDTGEKAALIGAGVATVGVAGGALLSDPGGRKLLKGGLEGVNLAAPLTLIPYMPLTGFKYTLPTGASPDKRLFKFDTTFKADDLINLHTSARGLPKMSFTVNMQWGYDPANDRLSILGGDASLGVVPGLTLSAGAYKDILRPPQILPGPEGRAIEVKKSIPGFPKPQPIPDVRVMLNVDLLKFKPGDLVRQIKGLF